MVTGRNSPPGSSTLVVSIATCPHTALDVYGGLSIKSADVCIR